MTARDSHVLLGAIGAPRLKPEAAVQRGLIVRQKVEGMWIYAVDDALIETAIREMEGLCLAEAHNAFLGLIAHLAGRARKHVSCTLHPQAAQQVLKLHIRRGTFGGLGLLTKHYEPYIAVFAEDEREEVDRILRLSVQRLEEFGALESDEVPPTNAPRGQKVWRDVVLRHLEFQGWGWMEQGRLVGGCP
ncbi:hypothetical protein [Intrasporangium mesophilum]